MRTVQSLVSRCWMRAPWVVSPAPVAAQQLSQLAGKGLGGGDGQLEAEIRLGTAASCTGLCPAPGRAHRAAGRRLTQRWP